MCGRGGVESRSLLPQLALHVSVHIPGIASHGKVPRENHECPSWSTSDPFAPARHLWNEDFSIDDRNVVELDCKTLQRGQRVLEEQGELRDVILDELERSET
eukprot:3384061-Rhodomonas_salina.1